MADSGFTNTKLYIPGNGRTPNRAIQDRSNSLLYASGNNVAIKREVKKFRQSALKLSGSNSYINVPYNTTNLDWYTTGQDYTLETYIYLSSFTGVSYNSGGDIPVLIGDANPNSVTNYWSFGPLADGSLRLFYYNGGTNFVTTSSGLISLNTLHHIAFSKTASGITLFVDGVAGTPTAISGTPQSSDTIPLTIGRINSVSITAYIDGLRIKKGGTAIYGTSNFTPPTVYADFFPYALSGDITESFAVTKWLITAINCFTGEVENSAISTGATYTLGTCTTDPCIVTIAPYITGRWTANEPVNLGEYFLANDPIGTPHIWEVTTAGTFGAAEASWNLSGTTTQGTAVLTYLAALDDGMFVTHGPRIPS